MGVSKILGYLVGGTRIPYSQGGAEYPSGVHNILGYMEWGCQIYCDTRPNKEDEACQVSTLIYDDTEGVLALTSITEAHKSTKTFWQSLMSTLM